MKWATLVFAYVFTWHALYILRGEHQVFAEMREEYLTRGDPDFAAQTLYTSKVTAVLLNDSIDEKGCVSTFFGIRQGSSKNDCFGRSDSLGFLQYVAVIDNACAPLRGRFCTLSHLKPHVTYTVRAATVVTSGGL